MFCHFWSHLFQLFPLLRCLGNHFIFSQAFLNNKEFSGLNQLCFLLIVYFTYPNYNTIFLNVGYKKLLWVTCEFYSHLLLD
jgi:hypothetical protein